MLAIVYRDEENDEFGSNWLTKSKTKKSDDKKLSSNSKTYIKERLTKAGLGCNAEILSILESASDDRIVDIGIRDRYFPLLNWASKSSKVILAG